MSGHVQSSGVDDRQIWEYLVNSTGSDVLIRSDADFVIEWVSPSVRRLLGFGPDELVGVTLGDLIHPDDVVPNGRSRDGGEVVYFRGRLRRFDGSYRWVESRSQPTRDANGLITGYVGLARDIDAEVRPPTESAWTGGLLEAVTDGMMDPQGIVKSVRDEHGTIVDFVHLHANQALCEFLGMPRGQVIGRSLHHVFAMQLIPEAIETGVRIVEAGSPLILDDFPMPNANGEAWVSARATKLGDGFIYTFRDVTAAHRPAKPGGGPRRSEDLPRTQGGVQAFMAAMSTAPIGVCLVDPDTGRFLEVNPALCRILGRTPEELVTCTWRDITHPDDVDIDAHLLDEMLVGNREGFRRRKRYLRPDGTTVWADIFVSDIDGGPGSQDRRRPRGRRDCRSACPRGGPGGHRSGAGGRRHLCRRDRPPAARTRCVRGGRRSHLQRRQQVAVRTQRQAAGVLHRPEHPRGGRLRQPPGAAGHCHQRAADQISR